MEDLRQMLEAHTRNVPDSTGILQYAQTGAARLRRRRAIARVCLAAVAVAGAAAGVPSVLRVGHDHSTLSHQPPAIYHRAPGQFTVGVAAGADVTFDELESQLSGQTATLSVGPHTYPLAQPVSSFLEVHDPGTYDPTAYRHGTRTTVQGQAAWLNFEQLGPDAARTVLGWQDPSGPWLLLTTFGMSRSQKNSPDPESAPMLKAIAETLRIGPAHHAPLPYQLNWLPDNWWIDRARAEPVRDEPTSYIELSSQKPPPAGPNVASFVSRISTWSRTSPAWAGIRNAHGRTRTTFAGHAAWLRTTPGPQGFEVAVEVGTCGITISADNSPGTLAHMEHLVRDMVVGDCTDPTSWLPVIG